ncbi:hypothetical protein NQ318_010950, partial [Aromia moschata]
MNSPFEKQDYLIQIRDKLRRDGIKLWLSPYLNESESSAEDIKKLSEEYSESLKIPYEFCNMIILELQANSLENLKQKNRYQESGFATIKIKVLLPNTSPQIITKELLMTVDNYALLDLDIAWCYLCLESFAHLPEAYDRLKR